MEKAASEAKSPFSTEPIGRLIAKFAIPCVISLLVNSLYNIVDQIFIGWGVGYLGNGATNVVFPITIIALALSLMIGDGGAAYLSLKLGEGDLASAKKGVCNAIAMVTVVSIVLMAVFLIFINPILNLFGATDTLRPYALEYGYVIGIGLPFMMIPAAINSIIRADGSPKYAMFSMVIGAVINTIFDPVFIFVFHMGVRGAAIATVMGQVASFIVSVVYMPRFKSVHLDAQSFLPQARTCGNILSFGISSFITQFAITIVMALTNNLLADYGAASIYGSEIPLTATGIVMKVNQILISILVGISVGTQPIIGFNYGAKNFMRVKKALDIALVVSEIISIIAFLIFQFAPHECGLPVRLRGGAVQRVRRHGLPYFPAALPPDRLPDCGGGLSSGGGQAPEVRPALPVPADHLFCAYGHDTPHVPGCDGRPVDRPCCGWPGLPALCDTAHL